MPDHSDGRDSAFWTWLLPGLTFLAGAVLAGAGVFLAYDDRDEDGDADADAVAAAPSATATPSAASAGDELVVQVPAQCVQASEAVRTVTSTLDNAVDAVQDFDAAGLRQTINALEELRPGLEQASQACLDIAADGRIVTPPPAVPSPPPPTATTTATPQASAGQ